MKKLLFILILCSLSTPTIGEEIGCVEGNCKNGTGTYNSPYNGGEKYIGEFKDSKMHGLGTYIFSSGYTYVGDWKDDKMNGQGTKTSPDGEYTGEWKDGKMNGQGTKSFRFGEYTGDWKDDKMNGQGTWTDNSTFGYTYIGEWKDGKEHGHGTITYKYSGEKYVGKWIDGERADIYKERLAEERAKKKYNTIYNACLLDKSKEVDMQVKAISEAVYKTCKDIATDPSWYENFKYNK